MKWRSRLKRIMRTASRYTWQPKMYDMDTVNCASTAEAQRRNSRAPRGALAPVQLLKKTTFFFASTFFFVKGLFILKNHKEIIKSIQLFLSSNASQQTLVSVSKTPRTLSNDCKKIFTFYVCYGMTTFFFLGRKVFVRVY